VRRTTTLAVWAAAAVTLAAAVITSSNAIPPRTGEPNSPGDIGWDGDGPVPTPSCGPFGCWNPIVVSESFDGQAPPMLPPGWIATNALGPPPLWVTSDSGVPIPPSDGEPNAAFIDDPAVLSDKRLDSPPFGHFVNELDLRFRHNFNLEASDKDPTLGFDGAVLEVSLMVGILSGMFLRKMASSSKAATTALSALIAVVRLQAVRLGAVTQRVSLRPWSECPELV
jgi:hypothetical protein